VGDKATYFQNRLVGGFNECQLIGPCIIRLVFLCPALKTKIYIYQTLKMTSCLVPVQTHQ